MSESNSQCLFVGAALSSRSVRALSGAASEMRAGSGSSDLDLRWVAPARYHVTLKYIGWSKPAFVPAILDAVSKVVANTRSFDMRCRDLNAFPTMEKAEVLWAGIDDRMGELAKLAGAIDSALGELGVEQETKAFVPHVTIARLKRPGNLVKLAQLVPEHVFSKSSLKSLILYESSVESGSSEFKKIADWSLE